MGGTCGTNGAQKKTGFRQENRRELSLETAALFESEKG